MLGHRVFGPMLREWHHHRSIPYRTKLVAIVTMLVSFGSSILLVVKPLWLKALLAVSRHRARDLDVPDSVA